MVTIATLTAYADNGSGWTDNTSSTYENARSSGETRSSGKGETTGYLGQQFWSPNYYCNQISLKFDTSSIPDATTITSVSLSMWGTGDQSAQDFTIEARGRIWADPLDISDFVSGANSGNGDYIANYTLLATFFTSGWSASGYNTFSENGTSFRSHIDKTGMTRFFLVSDRQRVGSAPSGGNQEYVTAYVGNTGTANDPKLVVTYNTPPTAPAVTAPNGGETIDASVNITWNAATDPEEAQSALQYHIQHNSNGGSWVDIVALTAAGATNYNWNTAGMPAGTAYKVRIRAWDGTSFGSFDESNATFTISHNVAPNAPILSPRSNFDATGSAQVNWTFSDNDAGDAQTAYQVLVKRVSDGVTIHDSGKVVASAGAHTIPANALVNNVNYQWQARTWDSKDVVGPYSALSSFSTSAKPTAAITDPAADGAVIGASEHTVRWTFSDPESGGQSAYQVRLLNADGTVQISTTGKVLSTVARERIITGLQNNTGYRVEVTVWDPADVSSAAVVRTFTVSFTPPPLPTLVLTSGDAYINVAVSNPAPGAGEPAITGNDLYRDGVRIATGIADDGVYRDYGAVSGKTHTYYVVAKGVNGVNRDSTTYPHTLVLTSVWIHRAADPQGSIWRFTYDGGGTQENQELESDLLMFAGRTAPVAEFGDGRIRNVQQNLLMRLGDQDKAKLQAFFDSKAILCYRDWSGRKVYGVLRSLPLNDEMFIGDSTDIQIDEVSYNEAV